MNQERLKLHLKFAERHREVATSYFKGGLKQSLPYARNLYLNCGINHIGLTLIALREAIEESAGLGPSGDREKVESDE